MVNDKNISINEFCDVKECVWQTHFQSRSATLTKELITEMLSM